MLMLSACSSDGSTSSTAASTVIATPTASATPSESATASPSPSPTLSGPAFTVSPASIGLHVDGVQAGAWPDSNLPVGSLRLWDNGTAWSQVESVRGRYNWTLLDTAVATAEDHGVDDIMLVLGSTPTWNATKVTVGDYPVPGAASAPKDYQAWDKFVSAAVERYAGRITAYQIWNEASLAMFWNGSPQRLAKMTKRAYDIIKHADPKATVVAASTTVRLAGAFDRFYPAYLAALADEGWPVDAFAAHLYPASRGDTDDRAAFIEQVNGALASAGAPDLPVWDTELNYGLAGPGPKNPLQQISGSKARDWVVETAMDSLHLGISRTYWYIWTAQPYPLLGMQLTNDSGAAAGLRVVDQWTLGADWQGCEETGTVVACHLIKKGVPAIIAWSTGDDVGWTPPEGFVQACTTAKECLPINGSVLLSATPQRITE